MARKSVEVVFQEQGGINDVFLGINHYISTGDFYGAGMALDARAGLLGSSFLRTRPNCRRSPTSRR
jgi:hypothetical protein